MSCIKDDLIQKYVDNETSQQENAIIRTHAENCSKCAKVIEERRAITSRLKSLINSDSSHVEIPAFEIENKDIKGKTFHINRWIIYSTAAACIIAAIFIFNPRQEENAELMFSYNLESEYNANVPLSEQVMVLEIIDSKGNLITF